MIKNTLKNLIVIATIIPKSAFAKTNVEDAFVNSPGVPNNKDIVELINPLITAVLGIAATIAVLIIIVGGFQYVTAAGNPESIQKAKNSIMYAAMGLIAAILGYAIITFILTNIVR